MSVHSIHWWIWTKSIEWNFSWSAPGCSFRQKLPHFMKPENLLPYLNYPSLGSIVSQFNPVHNLKSQLFKINFMSYIHLRLNRSGNSFSWFLTKTFFRTSLCSYTCCTPCTFHISNVSILIVFDENCKSWRTSLCSILHPVVTSPSQV